MNKDFNNLIERKQLTGLYLSNDDPWIADKFNAIDYKLENLDYLENAIDNDLNDLKIATGSDRIELLEDIKQEKSDMIFDAAYIWEVVDALQDIRKELGPIYNLENFNSIIHDRKYNKLDWMVNDNVLSLRSNNSTIKIFKCGLIAVYKGINFLTLENVDTLENLDQIINNVEEK